MYELKWVRVTPIVIGTIFILYGWTQSYFTVESSLADAVNLGMKQIIKSYVFIFSGLILIFMGVLLGAVMKYIHSLEERIYREMRDE